MRQCVGDLHRSLVERAAHRAKVIPEIIRHRLTVETPPATGTEILVELDVYEALRWHEAPKILQEELPFLRAPLTFAPCEVESTEAGLVLPRSPLQLLNDHSSRYRGCVVSTIRLLGQPDYKIVGA